MPYCAKCKRRDVVAYAVDEEIKRTVLLNRWNSGVCLACFDELAEKGNIRYEVTDLHPMVWSDRVPRNTKRRR